MSTTDDVHYILCGQGVTQELMDAVTAHANKHGMTLAEFLTMIIEPEEDDE